jgi:large subunit ribosomal protein L10
MNMAVSKAQKAEQIESLQQEFGRATSVVLTEFSGLSVNDDTVLRRKLRDQGVVYRVVKNTLARRALEGTSMAVVRDDFVGPIGVAFGGEDPTGPARVLVEFTRTNEKLKIKSGCVEGSRLDVDGVRRLAKLPSKAELRASLLGVLDGPARQMVGVLAAPAREFVGVLKAYEDKLSQQA